MKKKWENHDIVFEFSQSPQPEVQEITTDDDVNITSDKDDLKLLSRTDHNNIKSFTIPLIEIKEEISDKEKLKINLSNNLLSFLCKFMFSYKKR